MADNDNKDKDDGKKKDEGKHAKPKNPAETNGQVPPRAGQTVGGSAELGRQCRRPKSRAAMLIRIRVLNEQLIGMGLTDQPRS